MHSTWCYISNPLILWWTRQLSNTKVTTFLCFKFLKWENKSKNQSWTQAIIQVKFSLLRSKPLIMVIQEVITWSVMLPPLLAIIQPIFRTTTMWQYFRITTIRTQTRAAITRTRLQKRMRNWSPRWKKWTHRWVSLTIRGATILSRDLYLRIKGGSSKAASTSICHI